MSALPPCFPTPAALSPAENGRRHGRSAPPPPAPRRAAADAARRGRLLPEGVRAETKAAPRLTRARVARPRRVPARRRGGGRRDRVLAGELLHVAGALRSLRAGAVVAHQALRQVQGP